MKNRFLVYNSIICHGVYNLNVLWTWVFISFKNFVFAFRKPYSATHPVISIFVVCSMAYQILSPRINILFV